MKQLLLIFFIISLSSCQSNDLSENPSDLEIELEHTMLQGLRRENMRRGL